MKDLQQLALEAYDIALERTLKANGELTHTVFKEQFGIDPDLVIGMEAKSGTVKLQRINRLNSSNEWFVWTRCKLCGTQGWSTYGARTLLDIGRMLSEGASIGDHDCIPNESGVVIRLNRILRTLLDCDHCLDISCSS